MTIILQYVEYARINHVFRKKNIRKNYKHVSGNVYSKRSYNIKILMTVLTSN